VPLQLTLLILAYGIEQSVAVLQKKQRLDASITMRFSDSLSETVRKDSVSLELKPRKPTKRGTEVSFRRCELTKSAVEYHANPFSDSFSERIFGNSVAANPDTKMLHNHSSFCSHPRIFIQQRYKPVAAQALGDSVRSSSGLFEGLMQLAVCGVPRRPLLGSWCIEEGSYQHRRGRFFIPQLQVRHSVSI
jgi:hypothetical protein